MQIAGLPLQSCLPEPNLRRRLRLPDADLIATTDPASMTEHGQFCREVEQCQVRRAINNRESSRFPPGPPKGSGALDSTRARSALGAPACHGNQVCLWTLQVYAQGRVALTGDAAHLATPFLGQVGDASWQRQLAAGHGWRAAWQPPPDVAGRCARSCHSNGLSLLAPLLQGCSQAIEDALELGRAVGEAAANSCARVAVDRQRSTLAELRQPSMR